MENHNQNYYPSPPYPYNPAYGYASGPTPSNQYPPSPYPPPNSGGQPAYPPPVSGPYPHPPYPHYQTHYAPPPSGHMNYPYPSAPASSFPPPAPHHAPDYSSHPYQYHGYPAPPPPPSSAPPQSYDGFQYGQIHYLHHQTSGRLQPLDVQSETPPRASSEYSSHHRKQDSFSSVGDSAHSVYSEDSSPSRPILYPPIDDQLANMHLSDVQAKPSVPASPPAPASSELVVGAPQKFHSGPLPVISNGSGAKHGHGHHHRFSWWETTCTGKMDSSHPTSSSPVQYDDSMQLVPVSPSKTSLKVLLLHGNLDICIYEAKNLPNMDMFHKTIGDMFNKLPGNVSSKIEGQLQRKITSDPYVTITIAGATFARTYVISNDENPVWMQTFTVPVAHNAAEVNFVVKDNDIVGSQYIGTVSIPIEQIYGGQQIKGFFPILNASGKPSKAGAVLSLSIKYTPIEQLSIYYNGIGAGPNFMGVPQTYFPLRRGGKVTLYQDAHVPDGCLPNLTLGNGTQYIHGKCWSDIFDAIRHARRLIYITGWSIWPKVRLVRDDNSVSPYTLGELLRSKSQEGVRVLLLVWDDPTSRSILGYKTVSACIMPNIWIAALKSYLSRSSENVIYFCFC